MGTPTAPARRWPAIRRGASFAIVALLMGACASTAGRSAVPAASSEPTTGFATSVAGTVAPTPVEATASGSASVVSSPTPRGSQPGRVIENVPFVRPPGCAADDCSVLLDVYVPAGVGPFPTVVLVRGGPSGAGGRGYVGPFAEELAAAGLIVYNADMRDVASTGGGYPAAFDDVACAVRFARASSQAYGGTGGSVTLVGHSLGGFVGSVVALDDKEFTGGCLAGGSGRPDAFVGLSGNYDLNDPWVANDLQVFFGGSPDQTASARAASNPFNYATGTPIPVRLIAGTADATVNPAAATSLDNFLLSRHWDVTLTSVPGGNHGSIIDPSSDGPKSLAAVLNAIASTGS